MSRRPAAMFSPIAPSWTFPSPKTSFGTRRTRSAAGRKCGTISYRGPCVRVRFSMRDLDHARGLVMKAEHDLKIVRIGLSHDDAPLDTLCFHLQQAAEKLLKAALTFGNI